MFMFEARVIITFSLKILERCLVAMYTHDELDLTRVAYPFMISDAIVCSFREPVRLLTNSTAEKCLKFASD